MDLGLPNVKAQCVTWTQAGCAEVCVPGGELRTKAWHHLEWSSDEELLEWAGETPQLHAEGKLFVTEMKVIEEEAVEEEHAYSDDEPDDGASDPESVFQEAATELPLPLPPTPPFSSGASRRIPRILRSRDGVKCWSDASR